MALLKEIVINILPARLREVLSLLRQQEAKARRDAKIATKNRQKIDALMRSHSPIKLELGAGENRGIAGWTYVDLNENCDLSLDLTQPFPFPDNSVQMIYSSHLLEHFKYGDLINLLKECHRIIKPGGIFNAAVPNARIYLNAYQNPEGFEPGKFCAYEPAFNYNSKIDYVNYIAYMDGHHRYMFDEDNLIAILKKVCFRNIRLREFDEQLDKQGRNLKSIYVLAEK